MELQKFVKKGVTLMRPYVNGEDMSSISVSKEDKKLKTLVGGWIAYNPNDESDQWYISEVFFNDNYTPLEKKDLANASVALVDLLKDFLVEINLGYIDRVWLKTHINFKEKTFCFLNKFPATKYKPC